MGVHDFWRTSVIFIQVHVNKNIQGTCFLWLKQCLRQDSQENDTFRKGSGIDVGINRFLGLGRTDLRRGWRMNIWNMLVRVFWTYLNRFEDPILTRIGPLRTFGLMDFDALLGFGSLLPPPLSPVTSDCSSVELTYNDQSPDSGSRSAFKTWRPDCPDGP